MINEYINIKVSVENFLTENVECEITDHIVHGIYNEVYEILDDELLFDLDANDICNIKMIY